MCRSINITYHRRMVVSKYWREPKNSRFCACAVKIRTKVIRDVTKSPKFSIFLHEIDDAEKDRNASFRTGCIFLPLTNYCYHQQLSFGIYFIRLKTWNIFCRCLKLHDFVGSVVERRFLRRKVVLFSCCQRWRLIAPKIVCITVAG